MHFGLKAKRTWKRITSEVNNPTLATTSLLSISVIDKDELWTWQFGNWQGLVEISAKRLWLVDPFVPIRDLAEARDNR